MTCSASIWGLPRANSVPGVRPRSAYQCSVSFFVYVLLSFLASTLLHRSGVSSELIDAETKLVLDEYKGKLSGRFDSIRRFEHPDFFSVKSIDSYCYDNSKYNISGTLSVAVVNGLCGSMFCRAGADCNLKPDKVRRHKSLVVFLPEDGVTTTRRRLLHHIQGSIFSTLASGTFDPHAQVVFIRTNPLDFYYRAVYGTYRPAPFQAFQAYDVCKSLASSPVLESKYFSDTAPYNIVQYFVDGHRRSYDPEKSRPGYTDISYLETPTSLMLGWYQLLAFNNSESSRSAKGRLFNKISEYNMGNLPYMVPYYHPRQVVHPNEVVPTASLNDNAVVMVFGNNQFFNCAIRAGRLLGYNPSAEGGGRPRFSIDSLPLKTGIVENTDQSRKIATQSISEGRYLHNPYGKIDTSSLCHSVLMPAFLLSGHDGSPYRAGSFDEMRAREILYRPKEILCGSGPENKCKFHSYNRQYARDSIIYPGTKPPSNYYNLNNTFWPEDYYKGPADVRYNSMRMANVGLANFMANFKPNKIIQIELIPQEDSMAYKISSNCEGMSKYKPNKEIYLPLITAMGCPSVGLTHSNDDNERSLIDSAVKSYCSKDSPKRAKYGLHHCNSFSVYFDNIENNLPYREKYISGDIPYSSCRNTVLTLHMTDDPNSVFNYERMINYYHQILAHHLASGCDTEFSKESASVGGCVSYNTRYMYDVDSGKMHVVDTGEEVVPTCNISGDEVYREHDGKGEFCVEKYSPNSTDANVRRRIDMCKKPGIVSPPVNGTPPTI